MTNLYPPREATTIGDADYMQQHPTFQPPASPGEPAISPAQQLMTVIERMSLMPELDMDRVERAFAMHQKMEHDAAVRAFNADMAKVQSELQSVVAAKKNKHTESMYADIDAIHTVCKPVWTKYGFSIVGGSKPCDIPGHITMTLEVLHSGGHSKLYEDDWPLDISGKDGKSNKTAIQGKGSSTTYARRYMELAIFDIAISRLDNDGQSQSTKTPEKEAVSVKQVAELVTSAERKGVTVATICKRLRVESLADLTVDSLAVAKAAIANTKDKATPETANAAK